jgi:putative endonuclease
LFGLFNKREFGAELEAFAAKQMQAKGCKIIETNYLCKLGEIDIILQDKGTLVFVEVRYRKQNKFGGAIASVDSKKQKKIIKTASLYLQSKNLTDKIACRFDVFAIQGNYSNLSYNWIKDAFAA